MKLKTILKNISTVLIFSLMAKVMSFIIELLVAIKFGATSETDVYYMVIGIVQICYTMISVGIWKVFLPEYKTRCVVGSQEEANIIADKLIIIFVAIFAFLTMSVYIFPQYVIKVFAPGFSTAYVKKSIDLLRIVVFMFVFNCLATFSTAILQSVGKFSKSQVKEVVQYIPSILLLLFFSKEFGIKGLAVSFLLGAIISALVEMFLVRKIYKFRFSKHVIDEQTIKVMKQVPVTCLNSIVNQLNNIIDKAFSSGLTIGAVTYLNYGSKLIHLFDGIFSTAITTAIFPLITEMVAKKEKKKLNEFICKYFFSIATILIPISCLICLYSEDIVLFVFGHGKFDVSAARSTALVLFMYAIGLLAMSYTTIINDLFFVMKKTQYLLYTTMLNIGLNVIFDLLLIRRYNVAGLSLATTISLYIALFIKFYIMKNEVKFNLDFFKRIIILLISTGVSATISLIINNEIIDGLKWGWIISSIMFIICYGIIIVIIIPEYRVFIHRIYIRFIKRGK